VTESYQYDAWGRVTTYNLTGGVIAASALGNRYLFTGREYSYRTGLCHYRARSYDPVTGRFLSADPIGISGGVNLYAYCANNPVNFVDPDGLAQDKIGGEVVTVHKNDVDPWPSKPHGHIYEKGQVVDKHGTIFNKATRQQVGRLGKKALPKLLNLFGRVSGTLDGLGFIDVTANVDTDCDGTPDIFDRFPTIPQPPPTWGT
jgi:RHS repeat-associated protein